MSYENNVEKIKEVMALNPQLPLHEVTIAGMAQVLTTAVDNSLDGNLLEHFVQNCQAVQATMPSGKLKSRQMLSLIYQLAGFADFGNGIPSMVPIKRN